MLRALEPLHRARALLLFVPLIAACVFYVHRGTLLSHELAALSPVPLKDQQLDERLRADLWAPQVRFMVVAPDLPGHGFTDSPRQDHLSLPGMVRALGGLLAALKLRPHAAVGHSAGAAVALRMRLDGRIGSGGVVSLNGALLPFPGAAGLILPAVAKLLFLNPIANQMFAWRAANPGAVARLIESTGSRIDQVGLDLYGRLFRTTGHVAGALGMMAHWDLNPLIADLRGLSAPLTLVAAENDRAVPPSVSQKIAAIAPASTLVALPSLGHLAHEEAPERIAAIIRRAAACEDGNLRRSCS